MSSQSISNRINNLVKRKIIVGYRINVDFLKLGYKFYKVDITLTDYLKRNQLINILKTNPYLFMLTKTAGYADLELDFIVEDVTQLLEIIDDVKKKIPDVIKSYNYFFQPEIHKISYFPDIK
jgi:DNA-binding Lrp family transcriptional regulator